jgi:catechol 2,3-dioxygenase-like lactoylglutathione lyase family enzyme
VRVMRILHASVNVAGSLDETARFYADVLGMASAARPEIPGVGGRWLTAGDGQIHLVDAPMAGAGIDPTGPHFCLAVDDIESAVSELEDLGIPYVRASQPAGSEWRDEVVQVWFADPSGNTIELQQDHLL